MILSVKALDDELKAVKLAEASRLDGNKFGYKPITPNNVAIRIVKPDANQAVHHFLFAIKNLAAKSITTANSGTENRIGFAR